MKMFFLITLSVTSIFATELIYVSNDTDTQSLQNLEKKYKQLLLINDKKVYLIPSDCRLERYFGGASEAKVKLVQKPQMAEKIIITQDLFEATDEKVIQEKIEVKKSIDLVEGKVAKAFLDDKEGRGFGGASEVPLDFTFQKLEAKKIDMKPVTQEKTVIQEKKPHQHPHCQLLTDGSGYQLFHITDAQLYKDAQLSSLRENTILFK